MIYFMSMVSLRLPNNSTSLGYRYDLDEQALCHRIQAIDPCKQSKDPEKCRLTLNDMEQCEERLDIWVDALNTMCEGSIQQYHHCRALREEHQCLDELGVLYHCASKLQRPEWLMVPDLKTTK
jgi:hypothetical protein